MFRSGAPKRLRQESAGLPFAVCGVLLVFASSANAEKLPEKSSMGQTPETAQGKSQATAPAGPQAKSDPHEEAGAQGQLNPQTSASGESRPAETRPAESSAKREQPVAGAGSPANRFLLDQKSATELAAKVDKLVTEKFFDKTQVEKVWRPAFDAARQELCAESNLLSFSRKMNQVLSLLHASHTQFLTENDETFFFLRSLFAAFKSGGEDKKAQDPHKNDSDFTGLGIGGAHAEPKQVRYVLDASPAAQSGFKRGDRILKLNGRDYGAYADWLGTSGKSCSVLISREGKQLELKMTPVKQDFMKGYLKAIEKSARVINQGGRKIGYLHFWSGGEGTHEALENALASTFLNTDALILDLRDGYGAAGFDDLDMFFRPRSAYPDMHSWDRKGKHFERSYYDRPLVVLTNRGTRSGKELMSFGLKRSKRGVLVGDTTAGYVLGGQYNPLDSRSVLYLAIIDIKLDQERLEARGVAPDIAVEDKLGPQDPVFQKALEYVVGKLNSRTKSGHSAPAKSK